MLGVMGPFTDTKHIDLFTIKKSTLFNSGSTWEFPNKQIEFLVGFLSAYMFLVLKTREIGGD